MEEQLAGLLLSKMPPGGGTGVHDVRIECSPRGEMKLTPRIAMAD